MKIIIFSDSDFTENGESTLERMQKFFDKNANKIFVRFITQSETDQFITYTIFYELN